MGTLKKGILLWSTVSVWEEGSETAAPHACGFVFSVRDLGLDLVVGMDSTHLPCARDAVSRTS